MVMKKIKKNQMLALKVLASWCSVLTGVQNLEGKEESI